jgi:hypothetical protein
MGQSLNVAGVADLLKANEQRSLGREKANQVTGFLIILAFAARCLLSFPIDEEPVTI